MIIAAARLPIVRWIGGEPQHREGVALFQRAIAAAILIRVATEFRFAAFLWGPNSIAPERGFEREFGAALGAPVDRWFSTIEGTQLVLAVLALSALALLFQRWTRVSVVAACITFTVLGLRLPELNDGGDNVATLALLYMVGVLPAGAAAAAGSLRAWIHNLAVLAVIVQVCIVYFVAGFLKIQGESWHNGTALFLISQVEWFSSPATRNAFAHPVIATAGAYSTMLFQVWFPIALFSRFKLAFIAVAMGFHVGIAVTMGLLTFSIVMAGADLSLIGDDEYAVLRRRVRLSAERWREAGRRVTAPAVLFIDGDCAVCRWLGTLVTRFARRVDVQSFRQSQRYEEYGMTIEQLEQRMQLVVPGAEPVVAGGFEAFCLMAWRTPLAWPALPALYAARVTGVGPVAYRMFARNRHRFFAGGCGDRCSVVR
jgi:predicted DCC family thiol-disulfide oxidoreductase YuxK